MTTQITAAQLHPLKISPITVWLFVELSDDDGRRGWGEATLNKQHHAVIEAAGMLLPRLIGEPVSLKALTALAADERLMPQAALLSAVDMAIRDVNAQAAGQPLHAQLGHRQRERVEVYANINRRTVDRDPAGFAASAKVAQAAGFSTFKIAPFDEINPAICDNHAGFEQALRPGLERIEATRDALGAHANLRVDCHWRFTKAAAEQLLDAVQDWRLDWVECPLPETAETIPALTTLRRQANGLGMRLAGLEMGIGLSDFAPFLKAGTYDVIMPDVKYLGGLDRFGPLAELATRHGAILSPHNPTGPVSHAASLHVAACLDAVDSLELQFDETPHFDGLVGGPVNPIIDSWASIPTGPGLGVDLDPALVRQLQLPPEPAVKAG